MIFKACLLIFGAWLMVSVENLGLANAESSGSICSLKALFSERKGGGICPSAISRLAFYERTCHLVGYFSMLYRCRLFFRIFNWWYHSNFIQWKTVQARLCLTTTRLFGGGRKLYRPRRTLRSFWRSESWWGRLSDRWNGLPTPQLEGISPMPCHLTVFSSISWIEQDVTAEPHDARKGFKFQGCDGFLPSVNQRWERVWRSSAGQKYM